MTANDAKFLHANNKGSDMQANLSLCRTRMSDGTLPDIAAHMFGTFSLIVGLMGELNALNNCVL